MYKFQKEIWRFETKRNMFSFLLKSEHFVIYSIFHFEKFLQGNVFILQLYLFFQLSCFNFSTMIAQNFEVI